LRVGLNLIFLVPGQTGGMETYARELISSLLEVRPGLRLSAFVNQEAAAYSSEPWRESIPAIAVPVRASRRVEWVRGEQLLLPRLAARAGVDLMHSLGSTSPIWGPFRRVVTVHDLIYRVQPEGHRFVRGLGMRVLVPLGTRRADRVVAVSASTRDDLVRLLRLPAEKIDVVPNGVCAPKGCATPESELRTELEIGQRAVALMIGAKRGHKNQLRLLEALVLIPRERRPVLVLAGPGGMRSYERKLRSRTADLGLEADVRSRGWVTRADLEGLYALASVFVFPSLYEGFGLPVLEAMARGIPVACSDRGSLPEIATGAALLFDPTSPKMIAQAIERLLHDTAERQRLQQAGRERATRFSWRETARMTIETYERALASRAAGS
jgi:glycosyltransferase involved in cell wall biosynthesis